jgi:hypothetical protein
LCGANKGGHHAAPTDVKLFRSFDDLVWFGLIEEVKGAKSQKSGPDQWLGSLRKKKKKVIDPVKHQVRSGFRRRVGGDGGRGVRDAALKAILI